MDIKAKLELLIEDYESNTNKKKKYEKGRLSAFKAILDLCKKENKYIISERDTNTTIPDVPKEQRSQIY